MLRRSRIALTAVALSVTTFAVAAYAGSLSSLGSGTAQIQAAASGLGNFKGQVSSVTAREKDGKLVFKANLTCGLDMGIRDDDTRKRFKVSKKDDCEQGGKGGDHDGDRDKNAYVRLTVDKDKLKFPEDKKEVKGSAPAKLKLASGEATVTVDYVVSRTGSDYHIKDATFTFDYTKLVPKICLPGGIVCVKPDVTVKLGNMKLRDKG
jgi:hypothetical protein